MNEGDLLCGEGLFREEYIHGNDETKPGLYVCTHTHRQDERGNLMQNVIPFTPRQHQG